MTTKQLFRDIKKGLMEAIDRIEDGMVQNQRCEFFVTTRYGARENYVIAIEVPTELLQRPDDAS